MPWHNLCIVCVIRATRIKFVNEVVTPLLHFFSISINSNREREREIINKYTTSRSPWSDISKIFSPIVCHINRLVIVNQLKFVISERRRCSSNLSWNVHSNFSSPCFRRSESFEFQQITPRPVKKSHQPAPVTKLQVTQV